MTFLTIIAPLVAMTYPLDKMNDGQAQAFNMWFKEYIFNLLIQPMHLLLYMILIGSAMAFATENLIYVIVALGFMAPAEKLIRSFFGFEKAKTPGLLTGAAGTALIMQGMNGLLKKFPGGKGGADGKNGKNTSDDDNNLGSPSSIMDYMSEHNTEAALDSGDSETGDGDPELDDTGSLWAQYIDSQDDASSFGGRRAYQATPSRNNIPEGSTASTSGSSTVSGTTI